MRMDINIKIKANPARGIFPSYKIELNDRLLEQGTATGDTELRITADVEEHNRLRIIHHGKTNRDTVVDQTGKIVEDKSIEIKQISIGGIDTLTSLLFMQPFYVDWPENIIKEHSRAGTKPPEFITMNLYLGFNGAYEYKFYGDLDKHRFEQYWQDEAQAHMNQTKIEQGKEVFERLSNATDINRDFDLTIHDLARSITDQP